MDTYRIRVILFSGIQFRTGHENQAKSTLEQGQVSEGPVAHPHQNFCLVPPPPPRDIHVIIYCILHVLASPFHNTAEYYSF